MAPYVIGAHPICRCTYKLIADTYVQSFVGGSAKIRLSATPVGAVIVSPSAKMPRRLNLSFGNLGK